MNVFNKDNPCLFVFLCVLCASARVNIDSFFYIAHPDRKSKSLGAGLYKRSVAGGYPDYYKLCEQGSFCQSLAVVIFPELIIESLFDLVP